MYIRSSISLSLIALLLISCGGQEQPPLDLSGKAETTKGVTVDLYRVSDGRKEYLTHTKDLCDRLGIYQIKESKFTIDDMPQLPGRCLFNGTVICRGLHVSQDGTHMICESVTNQYSSNNVEEMHIDFNGVPHDPEQDFCQNHFNERWPFGVGFLMNQRFKLIESGSTCEVEWNEETVGPCSEVHMSEQGILCDGELIAEVEG